MKTNNISLKLKKFGVLLMMEISINANAGLFGSSDVHWKEEVQLHDGRIIIVDRSQSYGGRHEIGQSQPIKSQEIRFTVPGTTKVITFKSEYNKDIGRSDFDLVALHLLNSTPYIVTTPNLCLSYNKWGRPNPPYVIFRHDGSIWRQINLNGFPSQFKEINLVAESKGNEKAIVAQPIVSAELVKKLNSSLRQPEYRKIYREPIKRGTAESSVNCEEVVFYKGAWVSPGDSIGKRMMDRK